jgi:glucan phosphorylase
MSFGDILEAAGNLSVEDQESLLDILQRRLTEYRRGQVARDIEEAREALRAGKCHPATPDEIFQEITS